jgi:mannose-6-phosphate isomerase-like protein (cupin superfamily)
MIFHQDIFDLTRINTSYRKEVVTGNYSQVVLMSIPPQVEVGEEVHKADQIFVIVAGQGQAIIEGVRSPLVPFSLLFVPAGTRHNIVAANSEPLKLFTIYAPPQHQPGTEEATKEETYGR